MHTYKFNLFVWWSRYFSCFKVKIFTEFENLTLYSNASETRASIKIKLRRETSRPIHKINSTFNTPIIEVFSILVS